MECKLASLGLEGIDEAADTALTLSGLRIESRETYEEVAEGRRPLAKSQPECNRDASLSCRRRRQGGERNFR